MVHEQVRNAYMTQLATTAYEYNTCSPGTGMVATCTVTWSILNFCISFRNMGWLWLHWVRVSQWNV